MPKGVAAAAVVLVVVKVVVLELAKIVLLLLLLPRQCLLRASTAPGVTNAGLPPPPLLKARRSPTGGEIQRCAMDRMIIPSDSGDHPMVWVMQHMMYHPVSFTTLLNTCKTHPGSSLGAGRVVKVQTVGATQQLLQ
jgi:hypothetical protein